MIQGTENSYTNFENNSEESLNTLCYCSSERYRYTRNFFLGASATFAAAALVLGFIEDISKVYCGVFSGAAICALVAAAICHKKRNQINNIQEDNNQGNDGVVLIVEPTETRHEHFQINLKQLIT